MQIAKHNLMQLLTECKSNWEQKKLFEKTIMSHSDYLKCLI